MVKITSWRPNTNQEKIDFSHNAKNHLPSLANDFAIAPARIDDLTAGLAYAESLKKFKISLEAYHKSFTAFNNNSYHHQAIKSTIQAMPVLEAPPANWQDGWYDRLLELLEEMRKNTAKMTDAILKLLLMVDTKTQVDPLLLKPVAKAKTGPGGFAQLSFSKLGAAAVRIYSANAGGAFAPTGTSTTAKFVDDAPLPPAGQAVVRAFKIILLDNNVEVGLFSDIVYFTVTGV